MLQKERQDQILSLLQAQGAVKISQLTEQFGVSVITIRRDFDEMARQGLIKKVYGGAVLPPAGEVEAAHRIFNRRIARNHSKKQRIGKAAAALVEEGDTIVLDIGTTALEIAKNLKDYENLTVLTNSLPILNELAGSHLNVYSLGGRLRGNELALCGSLAFNSLNSFCVDKAFIGAGGITLEHGITDFDRDSAELCAAIVQRSKMTVLVSDSSKIGRDVSAVIGPLSSVDLIITDAEAPQDFLAGLQEQSVKYVTVDI